ncbi:MAG: ATP-binding cassette domain-containing protein [Gammaproteobacteria bacterium]|nr:ATP-binding cassette domain-containing protein [Gammaproteobacteria bacterium]
MSKKEKSYIVQSANPKGCYKNLTVRGSDGSSITVRAHRFAVVGKGDHIRFGAVGNNRIFVVSKDASESDIPLTPIFSIDESVSVGQEKFELRIREIKTELDMRALEFLEQFHYKTNSSLSEKSWHDDTKSQTASVGGRRSVLYAEIKIGRRWLPAGYIDLQMPLMMCKPRHVLFNCPYSHPRREIAWECWDQHAIKSYLNTIVRIGRVVVSPELRGLGVTRPMIKAAKMFAAERWHIGGMRPVFMEISAEMLNHIDFVSSSGFRFIGRTEGNISRVVKDMEQMARAPNGEFGMMSLQRKYYRVLEDYCKTFQISFEEGLEILRRKIEENSDALSTGEWAILRSIIRHPIPYYLCALDDYTVSYLRDALRELPLREHKKSNKREFTVKSTQIDINGISIRAAYNIPETRSTKIIMDIFGLKGDTVYADIVQNVDVKASTGNIILVVGTSGSGKSIFLNSLDPAKTLDGNLMVKRTGNLKYSAGWLRSLRSEAPIFEVLAEKFSPERAFIALSRVGLSEALVFIKPFWMLSRGQQYRAMIADLLLRDEEVWLLDEFCSDLDPITAKIVAHNLRKQVIASGRIAFIAAANHGHFLDALRPTKVLMLRPSDQPVWLSYKEYQNEFLDQVG